jgi:hypothetical protein
MVLIPTLLFAAQVVSASGLDVQLKDLRGSYFYVVSQEPSAANSATRPADCTKLAHAETKKYGRLTHCDPESDHVMCKPKDTSEKLFLFETKEACEKSLKSGVEPSIDED